MHTGKYESSENSNVGTAITFLLIGLGVGALTGLLLAPKTGKAFRKDIKRGYDDARDKIEDWTDDAKSHMSDVRETAREVGDRLRDAANRGADIASDLRERVEPLRRAINRS